MKKIIKTAWLVQLVKHERWKNWYSPHGTYCFMRKCEEGVWIGYLGNDISPLPSDTHKANLEELKQIHQFCLATNLRPTPFSVDKFNSDYPEEDAKFKKQENEEIKRLGEWVRKQPWYHSVKHDK